MSLLLTRMGRRSTWDRRFNPSFVLEVARGGLADMVRGATVSFSRASAAWAFDSSGVLRQYASGVPRIVPSPAGIMGVLREPQRTNKSSTYNANPPNVGGVVKHSGDASATVTLVNDAAALSAAGLSNVCSSGMVYCADNSTGLGALHVYNPGGVGNTNPHTFSVYARGVGTCGLGSGYVPTNPATTVLSASYSRVHHSFTPSNASDWLRLTVAPGSVAYFILQAIEEGEFATSPILTAGAQVTRLRDSITAAVARFVPMSMYLDCYLVGQRSDQAQVLVNWDDGSSNRWSIYQEIVAGRPFCTLTSLAGVTQMQSVIGNSTTTQRHRVALAFAENDAAAVLDGGSAVTDSVCAAPAAATTLRLGESVGANNQSAFWIHGVRLYASRLTVAQLQALTS